MSASIDSRPSKSAHRRPQWMRTARPQVVLYLWMWAIVWGAAAVVIAGVILLVHNVGTVNVSIAQFVRNGPLVWVIFGISIAAAASLTVHVANGMTRRAFVRGALVAGAVNAVLHGLTSSAVIAIEGAVYDSNGWQHDMSPGSDFSAGVWEDGTAALLFDSMYSAMGGTVAGLLVAIAYHRFGNWGGTLLLPLTLLPLLAVELMTNWSGDWTPLRIGELGGNIAAAMLVVAGAAAFALLARATPIHPKDT